MLCFLSKLKTRDSKLKPLGLVLTILTGAIESTPSVQPYLTCFSLYLQVPRSLFCI